MSLVRMLMEEFDCSLDAVDEVSVISNVTCYLVTAFEVCLIFYFYNVNCVNHPVYICICTPMCTTHTC